MLLDRNRIHIYILIASLWCCGCSVGRAGGVYGDAVGVGGIGLLLLVM